MRVQITSDPQGVPLAARLLIERAKTGKPLVYIEWGRQMMQSWASDGCASDLSNLP
jgi:hypothetical protein